MTARWLLGFVAVPILAQQTPPTASIRVTASLMSKNDLHSLFGPLRKSYSGARVDICSSTNQSLNFPSALVRQQLRSPQIGLPNGIVVVSDIEAVTVIASAQSKTWQSRTLTIGTVLVSLTALGATWSSLSGPVRQTLNSAAILSGEGLQIVSRASLQQLVNYTAQAAPQTIQVAPQGCAGPYIQLIEALPNAGNFELKMQVPVPAALN
jgi:hypothetical protein